MDSTTPSTDASKRTALIELQIAVARAGYVADYRDVIDKKHTPTLSEKARNSLTEKESKKYNQIQEHATETECSPLYRDLMAGWLAEMGVGCDDSLREVPESPSLYYTQGEAETFEDASLVAGYDVTAGMKVKLEAIGHSNC